MGTKVKLILYFISFCVFQLVSAKKEYTVTTKVGDIIGHTSKASFNGSSAGVLIFLGIPYALPPVGDLRFGKPRRYPNFQLPFNASELGPGCPQNAFLSSTWIPGPTIFDEDCLFLNIFVPFKDNDGMHPNISSFSYPVMIWIHGGAYLIGQSSMYSGDIISGFKDVIVVTLNYRLGALGFLTTGDNNAPGNNGLWDQHLAIKWVHENIGYFGGDPNKITLFGNSAGASSVIFHSMYSGNKGLIKRVISQSGSPMSAWAYVKKEKAIELTKRFATKMNCSILTAYDMIACLRNRSYEDIVQYSKVGTTIETLFRAEWVPFADGDFIEQFPPNSLRNPLSIPKNRTEMFSEIDIMVGVSSGDGGFIAQFSYIPFIESVVKATNESGSGVLQKAFMPVVIHDQYNLRSDVLRDAFNYVYSTQDHPHDKYKHFHMVQDISTDINFAMPATFTVMDHNLLSHGNNNTYLFRFSHLSSFNHDRPQWLIGANHGDELPYVFGFPVEMVQGFGYINNKTPEEIELSSAIMTYWTNFAKTGDPNKPKVGSSLQHWPAYNRDTEAYVDLEIPLTVRNRMFLSRETLWTDLAPKLINDVSQVVNPAVGQCIHQCPRGCSCVTFSDSSGCWCPDQKNANTTQQTLQPPPQTLCQDSSGIDCDYLAFTGICTNNDKHTRNLCPKTCNICH